MIEVEHRYRNVIFPTYVFELDLKEYDKDFFKEVISDHMVTRTDPLTLSSTDLHKDERMKEFCDFILDQQKSVMTSLGYLPQDLDFSGMWGVEQNKNGYHRQHFHPNNWMCGVFYVDTHEDDAIVFHDPRLLNLENESNNLNHIILMRIHCGTQLGPNFTKIASC